MRSYPGRAARTAQSDKCSSGTSSYDGYTGYGVRRLEIDGAKLAMFPVAMCSGQRTSLLGHGEDAWWEDIDGNVHPAEPREVSRLFWDLRLC
jgi:hypothetical protein